jgi:dipeptidyl aminopeptidase/acylaminoacyl peptidase
MPSYVALYRSAVSALGNRFAFTPTEATGFPLYCLDLESDGAIGAPREIHRSPKFVDDTALSPSGDMVVLATTERATERQYELMVFRVDDGRLVGELSDLPNGSVRALAFSPVAGDTRILGMSDRSGFNRPLLWNPVSGERIELELPGVEGEVEPLDWSIDGSRIVLRQTYRAEHRLYLYSLLDGTVKRLDHPGGSYFTAQFGPDGDIYCAWGDSVHLTQVVALDENTGQLKTTVLARGETPPARPARSVSFRSSDGEEIQGWLTLPEGTGPFPAVLSVHGGPLLAMLDFFDPESQAWADHGYAFLTINYRGSTTFGREFKEMIWGDLGHWEVEDMVAARGFLIREGIARPEEIVVTGASYGGYLTLMAMGKQPDLWACGMAIVAEADLVASYQQGTDWSRGYLRAMMGGGPDDKPEQYAASSPITYVDRVTAPLLVIQGKNDIRCPPQQMRNYLDRLRALGKPVTAHWFDAGHAGITVDDLIDWQEMMVDFADRTLQRQSVTV